MRVLIADDQRGAAQVLADLVLRCQHEVVEIVESGLGAIEAYQRCHPDVVLMDYWMAKLNGATAARNILAKDPAARIIFVSGHPPSSPLQEWAPSLCLQNQSRSTGYTPPSTEPETLSMSKPA